MPVSLRVVLSLTSFVALTAAWPLDGQGVADRLKQKVKDRAGAGADRAVDRALDKLEGRVHCLAGDDECVENAKKAGKKVALHETDEEVDAAKKADLAAAEAQKTSAVKGGNAAGTPSAVADPAGDGKLWENFDFTPGDRVLFADDFTRDRVGNFPQRLQLVEGNAQVVERGGKRWVSVTSAETRFRINLPEELGPKFTIEFGFTFPHSFPVQMAVDMPRTLDPDFEAPQTRVYLGAIDVGLAGGGALVRFTPTFDGKSREELFGVEAKARLQADGDYLKLYVNEKRVANVPTAKFGRSRQLSFLLWGSDETPTLIGNFVVAAGGMDLYDALMANGRVATQGIFFDTGSDRIRPESAPTLKQIGDMLAKYTDLRLLIEGHTDNVGSAASNLALSDRRAAAVRAYLTANFGIDAARLQNKGFGDTKPATPNTTTEGRQQNRRVELVKL